MPNSSAFQNCLSDKCILFKISDFQNLVNAVSEAKQVAVVGGGFLGSELACALAAHGKYAYT